MAYPQGMFKPRVQTTWVYQVSQSKLAEVAKALERSSVNEIRLLLIQTNEPMNRISDLTGL